MELHGAFLGHPRLHRTDILMEKMDNKEINHIMPGNGKLFFKSLRNLSCALRDNSSLVRTQSKDRPSYLSTLASSFN